MMFGLPGACLAMYRTATPARRAAAGGLLFSMALTSFLTGVTEPIEFAFMFLAPVLFAIHAVLTGIAMVLMHALGVHLGFGFSAGLFDYVLNYSLATRPLLLIPVGVGYFALYYLLFRFCIQRFDLKTLGREAEGSVAAPVETGKDSPPALAWIRALGGAGNLRTVEACTTRLRLVLSDMNRIDEPALSALGSRGVLRLADGAVQVVVGPIADQLCSDIRAQLRIPARPKEGQRSSALDSVVGALGGAANLREVRGNASRLLVTVRDPAAVDENALRQSVRAVARPAPDSLHVVVGPVASAWIAQLKDMASQGKP
jgi:PTS system N-acetylglucosamine-specific IIC component